MAIVDHQALAADLRQRAHRFTGTPDDYAPLLELVGDADVVLLGEATHGTHEFYRERAEITRQLILHKEFAAVAVEADWPDAYRVNRYVRGVGEDDTPEEALGDFQRFPVWMWRNADVAEFVDWLHLHNLARPEDARTGFYGLDLYSLYGSIAAVVEYLERVDPQAAAAARQRYGCFDQAGGEPQAYGYGLRTGQHLSCQEEVLTQLLELRANRERYLARDGLLAQDEQFAAEQNAIVVKNAETYYRTLFDRYENSWNLRDQHMSDTLEALRRHLARQGRPPKVVVWEHNSHIGDARATEMSRRGEHNLGQLARRRYGDNCRLIGFTTYSGTVTAASQWDGPMERKRVRPALQGSCEALLHAVGIPRFYLRLGDQESLPQDLGAPLLQRAIGVIYLPASERESHYFYTRLPAQFDALIHCDHTRALEPLDPTAEWERGEVPDTYPFGM